VQTNEKTAQRPKKGAAGSNEFSEGALDLFRVFPTFAIPKTAR